MYDHLMIDLETLGVVPGCAITQIGLAAFNAEGDIASKLIRVDIESCFGYGLFIQASTFRWWLGQNEEARAMMAEDCGLRLYDALVELCGFYDGHADDDTRVWSHGASFDEPILQVAARSVGGVKFPWHHGQIRDTRTLFDHAPDSERPKPEVAHSAQADAIAQARWVQNMLRDLRDLVK